MADQGARYQIAVMGSGNVGKTSFLKQYISKVFTEEYSETVEDTYIQTYEINGESQTIDFIDTAGSMSFPAMRDVYIQNANGFVLMYAINDEHSFVVVKDIWQQINRIRKSIRQIPCVIVGNKIDLELHRTVETFHALEWTERNNLKGCLFEVSSKHCKGIEETIYGLLDQIGNTRAQHTRIFRTRSQSCSCETTINTLNSPNIQEKRKSAINLYQEIEFEAYEKKNIERVVHSKRHGSRSRSLFGGSSDKSNSSERRRGSLPFDLLCGLKQEPPMYTPEDIEFTRTQNEDQATRRWSISGMFVKIRNRFKRSK